MKKALSLVLALVLCLALTIPAFAAQWSQPYLGRAYNGNLVYDITQRANMGDVGYYESDASVFIGPAMGATTPAEYYLVQANDDLEGIAYSFYGHPCLAQALYEYNKEGHFLATGGFLAAGYPLRIPDVLSGYARLAAPILDANGAVYQLTGGPNGGIHEVDEGIVYLVQTGDTLAKIIATFYNGRTDSFIINHVVARNPNLVNANSIHVGDYIILPAINIGM